ncbi:MAG: NAD-dependent epimerase/dehydratase family protein [Thalassolituus sp.]
MAADLSRGVALLVGATGLIGSHLLDHLIASGRYADIIVIARRQSAELSYAAREALRAGRLRWNTFDQPFPEHVDHFYCALGTTQKASGKSGLAAVDRDLVIDLANKAADTGAQLLSVVSATGADAGSMFFYNRIKGEMELSVSRLGVPCIQFWQPSVLLGERDEFRLAEKFAGVFLRSPLPKNVQARKGACVASAMVEAASQISTGIHRFKVREIDMFNSGETV